MVRVELFFGGAVGDRAWRRFVASIVSPRLPEGLTWFAAHGEWRGPHGRQRESAHVIVYLTPLDAAEDARIEAVRRRYKLDFHQQSVLRADTPACVSFR